MSMAKTYDVWPETLAAAIVTVISKKVSYSNCFIQECNWFFKLNFHFSSISIGKCR